MERRIRDQWKACAGSMLLAGVTLLLGPLSSLGQATEPPGPAGYPQFEVVPDGIRAFWSAGEGATGYRTTGNRIASELVTANERILPSTFRGLFCTLSTNSAGDAPDSPGRCAGYNPGGSAASSGVSPSFGASPSFSAAPSSGSSARPFYEFDPSTFETDEDFRAFAQYVGQGVTLTSGSIHNGTMGKFIRTTYPGNGQTGSPQFELRLPSDDVKEIWLETWVRMCDAWTGVSDDKILFLLEDHTPAGGDFQVNRWWFSPRSQGDWYGGPDLDVTGRFFPFAQGTPNQDREVWDGRWHRLRLHARHPTNEFTANGVFEVWWDDRLVESRSNANSRTPALARWAVVSFSMNADPRGCGTRDWGPVRAHSQNPGW